MTLLEALSWGFLVSVPIVSPGLLTLFNLMSMAICINREILLVL